MNLFSDFETRIKGALQQLDLVKEKGAGLDFSRIVVEPPRAMRATATLRPMPPWFWQSRWVRHRVIWP